MRLLITKYDVKPEGRVCNPVDINTYQTNEINAKAVIEINAALNEFPNLSYELAGFLYHASGLIAHVNPSISFNNHSASIQSNIELYLSPELGATAYTYENVRKEALLRDNFLAVESIETIASRTFQLYLWEKFIEEGTRMNKWN